MAGASYDTRRGELTTYFDRTAVEAWSRLTSDAPVSRIRATVRAGRDAMRGTLLSWLPADMTGLRLLDAGCGTGALSVEAARRGAEVVAIDVSPTLVELARERLPAIPGAGRIDFRVGDMLDPDLGRFDHVVAMDSLIHYRAADIVRALALLGARTDGSVLFTVAPRTALLTLMHAAGQFFPRGDRSPAIVPVTEGGLRRRISSEPALDGFAWARSHRVNSGFYLSNAVALTRTRPSTPCERGDAARPGASS
ncbi:MULTISPECIES: magnesium protoporphyrin IX methyltransferase [unclassified Methylobacterium]|uniref:magnesium protoporphyrin IX methyltransferase n=1 Tax=unclassified Methylobacterium TaxID=2615210 RepID=UPI0011C1E9B3|nr:MULTISPECIES: magnesium protoporphyrin IX methyltransferase [unclassified Methylobacterium]QEE39277.1 magnesium protoporphyrin IX methyltransferase [Methylobacterium sp. WL1]TXN55451.1 magnesium protoporphyrin IX methyltransferase [Methylobacterium sp. WL2]